MTGFACTGLLNTPIISWSTSASWEPKPSEFDEKLADDIIFLEQRLEKVELTLRGIGGGGGGWSHESTSNQIRNLEDKVRHLSKLVEKLLNAEGRNREEDQGVPGQSGESRRSSE